MQPYGREKRLKGDVAKVDYHIHKNGKKVPNWWEDSNTIIPRAIIKARIKKEIEENNG